jgi:hypothetical protein
MPFCIVRREDEKRVRSWAKLQPAHRPGWIRWRGATDRAMCSRSLTITRLHRYGKVRPASSTLAEVPDLLPRSVPGHPDGSQITQIVGLVREYDL